MINLNLRKIENLHITIWLFKDLCWVMHFRLFGTIMIIPTLLVAIYLTWRMRQEFSELTHNLAVCFWIMANSIWMIGEFFYEDGTRIYARIFFILGLLTIALHYVKYFYDRRSSAL